MSKKKGPEGSNFKSWERTGTHTFNVKHDDGSVFECRVDDPRKFDAFKGLKGNNSGSVKSPGVLHGIGERKPLICNNCKQRVGKITNKMDGRGDLCPHCV